MPEPIDHPNRSSERLMSLDAYRGFTMLAMASGGLGLAHLASHFPDSPFWNAVRYQAEHVPWVGCSVWDLIQPSFMFMVGVAMAYSSASRREQGHSNLRMLRHAAFRAIVLVLLGVFLRSNGHEETQWRFDDVVSQIGFGYLFLFLLWDKGWIVQAVALVVILVGYGALFALWPLPGPDFNYAANGIAADWEHNLSGFSAHWNKNTNSAQVFDRWFLNLFPRSEPFKNNGGGYVTLSFIPSLATMILGLMAGGLLRSKLQPRMIIVLLIAGGAAGLAAGYFLDAWDVCPVVKRIWTPSWVLFSGGWALLLLAFFCIVIDIWGWRRWAFPGVVTGMNSIAIYVMTWITAGWIIATIRTHLGKDIFQRCGVWIVETFHGQPEQGVAELTGDAYAPMLQHAASLLVMWLILLWMYRRRFLLKI